MEKYIYIFKKKMTNAIIIIAAIDIHTLTNFKGLLFGLGCAVM